MNAQERFFQRYADGVNWWLLNRPNDLHLEFKLAGIQPEPWDVSDCLTVAYYMGWITSANVETEIMAQMLIDKLGSERARELFPLNINPDDPSTESLRTEAHRQWRVRATPLCLGFGHSGPSRRLR